MILTRYVALASGLLLVASGCSAASNQSVPQPAAAKEPRAAASPAPSPVAQARDLGGLIYLDNGTKDVNGKDRQKVKLFDTSFEPTFLRAEPGTQIKLRLTNQGGQLHNVSIPSMNIDQDVPPGGPAAAITVTFPTTGAVPFFCKIHVDQGMKGQLLVGEIEPQPIEAVASPSPAVASPSPAP